MSHLPPEPAPAKPPIPLRRLLPIFTRIGLTSFGGGRIALYYDAFVDKRRWLTNQNFIEGLTVSQVLPGPTFANLSVFLGQLLGGGWGAAWALVLILAPGTIAMVALTHAYLLGTSEIPVIDNAFRGVGVAASGLTLVTVFRLLRAPDRPRRHASIALAAIAFLALGPLQLNLLAVVPPLIVAGLWLNRPGATAGHE